MWNLISLASVLFMVARSFYTTDDMYNTYDMYSTYDMDCTEYYCDPDTLDGCMDGWECMPDYGLYMGCAECYYDYTTMEPYDFGTTDLWCLDDYFMGMFCDMDGNGCYDYQECDLSDIFEGCGMCNGEMSSTMDMYDMETTMEDDSMEEMTTTDDMDMDDMTTTDDMSKEEMDMTTTEDSMEGMGDMTTTDSMDGMDDTTTTDDSKDDNMDDSKDDMATTDMDMDTMTTNDLITATEAGCTLSVIIATIFGTAVYGFM